MPLFLCESEVQNLKKNKKKAGVKEGAGWGLCDVGVSGALWFLGNILILSLVTELR